MITGLYTADGLAKELEHGTWAILEMQLRKRYKEASEKLIDEAVAATMSNVKMYVESVHKPYNGEVIFNLHINGVKQEAK